MIRKIQETFRQGENEKQSRELVVNGSQEEQRKATAILLEAGRPKDLNLILRHVEIPEIRARAADLILAREKVAQIELYRIIWYAPEAQQIKTAGRILGSKNPSVEALRQIVEYGPPAVQKSAWEKLLATKKRNRGFEQPVTQADFLYVLHDAPVSYQAKAASELLKKEQGREKPNKGILRAILEHGPRELQKRASKLLQNTCGVKDIEAFRKKESCPLCTSLFSV